MALCALLAFSSVAQALNPQPPELVSRRQTDGQPAFAYCATPRFDASNRFLAFGCQGFLVPGDTNPYSDAFLLDRATGIIELVSRSSTGQQTNFASGVGVPSEDGNRVAFLGTGPLHPDYGPPPPVEAGRNALYLRHRDSGQTDLISRDAFGASLWGAGVSFQDANVSGNEVLFSYNGDIRVGPNPSSTIAAQMWLRNWETGEIELVSATPAGMPSIGGGDEGSFSASRRYVVFSNGGDDLGVSARLGDQNLYLRDRVTGSIERLTYPWQGGEFQAPPPFQFSIAGSPRISADGRFVVYSSNSAELHPDSPGDGGSYVYLLDRQSGQLDLLSSTPGYPSFNAHADISDDGRYIAWASRNFSFNGPPNPPPSLRALWVLDRQTGQRVNVAETLGPLYGDTGISLDLSGDGSMIAFIWRNADPTHPQYRLDLVYTVDLRGPQPFVAPHPVPAVEDKWTLTGIAALLLLAGLRRLRRRRTSVVGGR